MISVLTGICLCVLFVLQKRNRRVIFPDYPERQALRVRSETDPMHLLLITVDTLRFDYLRSAGYDLETTPVIDRLIDQGMYFTHAVTPIPRTTPALASMLTGCYPYKTGVRRLWDKLSFKPVTIGEVLKRMGYQTFAVVSNHTLTPLKGLDRGFDLYDHSSDKRDAVKTSEAAIRHLKRWDSENPLFLWVHYIDPHVPYYPPEDVVEQFDSGYKGKYKTHFGQKPGGVGGEAYPKDIGKERAVYHNDLGEDVNRHIRRLYAADVRLTDMGIEKLLHGVRRIVGENLLIVFTADHGESLGEHDYYYEHGAYVYNPELRIPLGFVLPEGDTRNRIERIDDWVSLIDVLPTCLDLMGVEVESSHLDIVDGMSLLPYWEGRSLERRPLFGESGYVFYPNAVKRRVRFDIEGRFRSVIVGDFKLIWTPFQSEDRLYELYDVRSDPYEVSDLYRSDSDRLEELKAYLEAWMSDQPKSISREKPPSPKDMEILRSLGYVR